MNILGAYLDDMGPPTFKAVPTYFRNGDFLTYFMVDEESHSERVDEKLTIYRSFATNEIVGCRIKGVRHYLREAGSFGVEIKTAKNLTLNFLFLLVAQRANDDAKKWYAELGKLTSGVPFPSDLRDAA